MHRNKKLFIDKIKEINFCGNQILEMTGGQYEAPFSVEPTDGKHNLNTCQSCKKEHELLRLKIKELTDIFPLCCEHHSKLVSFPDFDIKDYKNLDKEIANKVFYTYHHIIENIDNEDWYEDITDYINYVIESFGSFPPEFGGSFQLGSYFIYVLELLGSIENRLISENISKREVKVRIEKVKTFLEGFKKEKRKKKDTDLNLLLNTYDQWFKIFPFQLTYFKHIRQKFKSNIPILAEPFHYNKYTNTNIAKLHTKESLTLSLIQTTKNIISQINGAELHKRGLLTDTQKIKYDLIINQREMELVDIQRTNNSKQTEYVRVLKKWFKGEKKFIQEITPYLKENPKNNKVDSKSLTINQIALKLFYESKIVTRENCSNIIKEFGHTSGDKLYNRFTYYSSNANRKGNPHPLTVKKFSNKIQLFKSVIEILEDPYKQKALDELKILNISYSNHFE